MNKSLLGAFASCALLLSSCEGTSLGSISLEESIPSTRIQGGGLTSILPAAFTPFALDVKSSDAFASSDYKVINEIKISGITLSILDESENSQTDTNENGIDDDFSFINTLNLYIKAEIDGVEQRELVAELPEDFADTKEGTREIIMQVHGIDILEFVEASTGYTVESEANGTAPADDVVFGGTISYNARVGFR